MTLSLPSAQAWADACEGDGEFRLAARHWHGGLRLRVGGQTLELAVADGAVRAAPGGTDAGRTDAGRTDAGRTDGVIEFSGDAEVWERFFAETPPRFHNDVMANLSTASGLSRGGGELVYAQYYAAAMRALELLRQGRANGPALAAPPPARAFDSPVGRYVHVSLDGHDHRLYFEEAGQGIPLLMQHTAGCHGSQWRHLFEDPEITTRFRLIAYDLPFHGKSLPPSDRAWWAERYDLDGAFLRSVPLELSRALDLDRPVFMGCSVGGLLALDLAFRHPESFRAVISVEGALKIDGSQDDLTELWHPQVSNEYKARLMEGLMSPTSPKAYRKETSFVYASGWPPVFLGDLYYYLRDFDLRNAAGAIDTDRTAVHILSGEYDWSGTSELGREAHEAITGSTWTEMKGVGHFPMSENPEAFIRYLKPILAQIA